MRAILEICTYKDGQPLLNGMPLEIDIRTYEQIVGFITHKPQEHTEEDLLQLIIRHAVADQAMLANLLSQIRDSTNETKLSIFIPVELNSAVMIDTYAQYLKMAVADHIKKSLDGLTPELRKEILQDIIDDLDYEDI